MADAIEIMGMEVIVHIGVPDEERSQAQRIEVDLTLHINLEPAGKSDQIEDTEDYFFIREEVIRMAQKRPRRLIEHLAEEIAQDILQTHPKVQSIEVVIRKYILPDTQHVAVRIRRPIQTSIESGLPVTE